MSREEDPDVQILKFGTQHMVDFMYLCGVQIGLKQIQGELRFTMKDGFEFSVGFQQVPMPPIARSTVKKKTKRPPKK